MDFSGAKEYITQLLVKELPKELLYHGAHHTFEVVKATRRLALNEKISKKDFNLLTMAAYFHDSGYLYQYKDNEPLAVELVQKVLPQFDFSKQEIDTISEIILATQSHIEPKNILEEIMCDADHDYIGTTNYDNVAKTLRKELELHGTKYDDLEWLKMQHYYLTQRHKYYTQTAKKTRNPQKKKIILNIEDRIINYTPEEDKE